MRLPWERLLGVRFQYAIPDAAAERPAPPDLSALPDHLRRELAQAADRLDVEATEAAIAHVRNIDPALADHLAELARVYRFDRIASLLIEAPAPP